MLEDTFVHRYVDVLLDTAFGSEPRFNYNWANGSLLQNKPQHKPEEYNSLSSSEDCEFDKAKQSNNTNNGLYKPDWVVYAKSGPSLTAIGVMELKVEYKRNPNFITDFVKLGKQMKLILHELLYAGVPAPVVCGILVQSDQCETFAMDLRYNGIYRMLGLDKDVLGMFSVVFDNNIELKYIAMDKAISLERVKCPWELGQPIPG
ncbi:hypothetical protein CLU79DRAFT_723739 [Phycomyces nitens]|nr:hypothetical protein CLU79DRAFT_723739 [Phycomyces nitens]